MPQNRAKTCLKEQREGSPGFRRRRGNHGEEREVSELQSPQLRSCCCCPASQPRARTPGSSEFLCHLSGSPIQPPFCQSRMQWLVSTEKQVDSASKMPNHHYCELGFLGNTRSWRAVRRSLLELLSGRRCKGVRGTGWTEGGAELRRGHNGGKGPGLWTLMSSRPRLTSKGHNLE